MKKLSVIVPGYNESHLSANILEGIKRTADVDYEIIFIDDGSSDNTPQIISGVENVKYIRHEENKGVPCAWNTGVKAAKGDYVAILNNDIAIADRSWMSKLLAPIQGKNAISGVEKVNFNSATTWRGKIQEYINGWCFAMPRRIFSEIGYFNEDYSPGGQEDVEFSIRAKLAGYDLVGCEDIRMQHMYAATRIKYLGQRRMEEIAKKNYQTWLGVMDNELAPYTQKLRIVFDCPGNMAGGWTPYSLEDRGLGGAETAITLLSRELARRGHEVHIFNDISVVEEGYGVTHSPRSLLSSTLVDGCDLFIVFRCPSEFVQSIQANVKLFWSCDQRTSGVWDREIFPFVDGVVCISDYHRDYLQQEFPSFSNLPFYVIGCPVASWNYEPHPEKEYGQFLFCSVPHRGLSYMPVVMREIRKTIPEATLIITSDYRLWGAPEPRNNEFKPMLANEKFYGMVPRADLLEYQRRSMVQPYPCTYLECFCIAVAECSSAGAIPVTTDIGAVKQTVGESGIIVGPPSGDFAIRIGQIAAQIHGNEDLQLKSIENSWRWSGVNIASKWLELYHSLAKQEVE